MTKFKPQYRRLLQIDKSLRDGGFPNCSSLAKEWEVSEKTIQRDIEYLRDELGAPIEYAAQKHGYCYSDTTWFMPSMVLAEGDLLALLLGTQALAMYKGTPIAGELDRVFHKLADVLPDKISVEPEFVHTHFSFVGAPARPINPEIWKRIVRGLMHQLTVTLAYRARQAQKPKVMLIHPYHLANLQGDWYLFGYIPKHDKILQLALSRIVSCDVSDDRFDVHGKFAVKDLLTRSFGKYVNAAKPDPTGIVLRFAADLADYVQEKSWHPKQLVKVLKDGRVDLTIPVNDLLQVQGWILSFGSSIEVRSPKEFRERILGEARLMIAQYRD